jgi:hypothetical protein
MGYATIKGGGPTGRYEIELDYGSQAKTDALAVLDDRRVLVEVKIAETQVRVTDAAATTSELNAQQRAMRDQYISAQQGIGAFPDIEEMSRVDQARAEAQSAEQRLRVKLELLQLHLEDIRKQITYWDALSLKVTKGAWCTDYTEDASGIVATIDVEGDSELILVAEGGRGWEATDGVLTARAIQSPAQVYWNAAAMPGWQKWLPTYRWGTITDLDFETDTAAVSLAAATSSAKQRPFDINQSATLSGVPVRYMTCNASAFEVGDRVIVQFTGQDWSAPVVIGFLDNPKPCLQYVAQYYVRGYYPLNSGNLSLINEQTKNPGDTWDAVIAISPTGYQEFMRWNDDVMTLDRSDGEVTEDLTKIALYAFAMPFQAQVEWELIFTQIGDPYFLDTEEFFGYVFDATVELHIIRSITLPSGSLTSPAGVDRTYVIWSGWVIDGYSVETYLDWLIGGETQMGSPTTGVPLQFDSADIVLQAGQTITFTLPGSGNEYSVTGTATNPVFPFPGGTQIPYHAYGYEVIDYEPDSWDAVYEV